MTLSLQDCLDLCSAISEAQAELCFDGKGKFPEANSYYTRLEALSIRIREYAINNPEMTI